MTKVAISLNSTTQPVVRGVGIGTFGTMAMCSIVNGIYANYWGTTATLISATSSLYVGLGLGVLLTGAFFYSHRMDMRERMAKFTDAEKEASALIVALDERYRKLKGDSKYKKRMKKTLSQMKRIYQKACTSHDFKQLTKINKHLVVHDEKNITGIMKSIIRKFTRWNDTIGAALAARGLTAIVLGTLFYVSPVAFLGPAGIAVTLGAGLVIGGISCFLERKSAKEQGLLQARANLLSSINILMKEKLTDINGRIEREKKVKETPEVKETSLVKIMIDKVPIISQTYQEIIKVIDGRVGSPISSEASDPEMTDTDTTSAALSKHYSKVLSERADQACSNNAESAKATTVPHPTTIISSDG